MKKDSIGTIIKNIRKDNNLSQQQFSEILGLNNSTISKWEHDLITPDITYLKIISEKFDIPLDKLINGEITPKNQKLFILSIIFILIIETITIIILGLKLFKKEEIVFYTITSDNKELVLNGNAIYLKDKLYLNINNIEYLYSDLGTSSDKIPEKITITLLKNNRAIENEYIENNNNENIEDLLSKIEFNIIEKYKDKDVIKIRINIQEDDNHLEVSSNIILVNKEK